MRFAILTPVLNGEKFLDQSILSVVSQAGPFTIRYHVQDGGSKDRTLEILAAWKSRLARDFPVFCEGIEFSFASAPDRGVYEAINRGFAPCAYADADAMAWIGSDDRFEPGAFATVGEIFRDFPDIDWVTGRTTVLREAGPMLYMPQPIVPFPRKAIAAGIFDGRFGRPFIEQEASFWRPRLWQKAGGVDPNFRLAGDFDLWRRFARQTDLVAVDAILGCFRMRAGQLSGDMPAYRAEIDASLSPAEIETRAKVAERYSRAGFEYRVMLRHYGGPWACVERATEESGRRLDEFGHALKDSQRRYEEAQRRHEEAQRHHEETERRLKDSLSWKLTRPLRDFENTLARISLPTRVSSFIKRSMRL
jgi:glycosyltransferase involved in cell wall biosynthesis